MAEKLPQFERPEPRTVGPASEEMQDKVRRVIKERFGEKHYDQFPGKGKMMRMHEYELKPYEINVVEKANEITNKLLVDAGQMPHDVPPQNIHIVPNGVFKETGEHETTAAITDHDHQAIVMNREKFANSKLYLASCILHEIVHLKGYRVWQVKENEKEAEDPEVSSYRSGLTMTSTFKKDERNKTGTGYRALNGLNEAAVSEIEKNNFRSLAVGNSELEKELRYLDSDEAVRHKKKIIENGAHEINIKIEADEFMWVSDDGKYYTTFPYRDQRRVLHALALAIYEDNTNKFDSAEEALGKFIKGHFNGNILELAKLVDKSFGEGSFKEVGLMETDSKSAMYILELLEKKRRILKSKLKKK